MRIQRFSASPWQGRIQSILACLLHLFSFKNAALFKASYTVQWYGIDAVLRPLIPWPRILVLTGFREVSVLDDVLEDFSSLRTNLGLSARQIGSLICGREWESSIEEIAGEAGYKFPKKLPLACGIKSLQSRA